MSHFLSDLLGELEQLRGASALAYCSNDRAPRQLTAGDIGPFSQLLQEKKNLKQLDFVLHSDGGSINAVRGLAFQLRECAERLEILVPRKARSAATLLCLAADQIVLGPLAELNPIDPLISISPNSSKELPVRISGEDIRCFRSMGENWFDLRTEESRLHLFTLLNERLFPTTLAKFYRADRYVRKVADEFLAIQLPLATAEARTKVVDQLITGYATHDEAILRRDVLKLGLQARAASEAEVRLLGRILAGCREYMHSVPRDGRPGQECCRAIFLDRTKGIQFLSGSMPQRPVPGSDSGGSQPPSAACMPGKWVDIPLF